MNSDLGVTTIVSLGTVCNTSTPLLTTELHKMGRLDPFSSCKGPLISFKGCLAGSPRLETNESEIVTKSEVGTSDAVKSGTFTISSLREPYKCTTRLPKHTPRPWQDLCNIYK